MFISTLEENSHIPSPALGMKQSWHIFDTPLRLFGGMRRKKSHKAVFPSTFKSKKFTQEH